MSGVLIFSLSVRCCWVLFVHMIRYTSKVSIHCNQKISHLLGIPYLTHRWHIFLLTAISSVLSFQVNDKPFSSCWNNMCSSMPPLGTLVYSTITFFLKIIFLLWKCISSFPADQHCHFKHPALLSPHELLCFSLSSTKG